MRNRLLFIAIGLGITTLAQAVTLIGQITNPLAIPADWQLPKQVIDTQTLPRVSLAASNSAAQPLPVYQLVRGTYFVFGNISTLNKDNRGLNGNAGFVVTREGVVVIDTLGTPRLGERLISTIKSITDQPIRYLIVTHNHPDHAYGGAAFQSLDGVTVIAHPGIQEYNNSRTLEESVAYRRELLPEDMQDFTPLQADRLVETAPFGHISITLGGQQFDIYNTGQHHSYGDLIVHQRDKQILWISDLAFNQRTTYMGDGDSKQILAAQDWLRKHFTQISLMVPGHGSPQTRPFPMLEKTHAYVERLRKEMDQAVKQGVGLYDAVQNSHFEEWSGLRLYEENHRANAGFVYREMEKAFFENF